MGDKDTKREGDTEGNFAGTVLITRGNRTGLRLQTVALGSFPNYSSGLSSRLNAPEHPFNPRSHVTPGNHALDQGRDRHTLERPFATRYQFGERFSMNARSPS
jgi:hypothetical protein